MAKKKKQDRTPSLDEYDVDQRRVRRAPQDRTHMGDGVHRLTAWAQRSVMGVDQYGRKVK